MCSDEIKGQAMAALLAGQGISEVARKYKIGKATAHRLHERIKAGEIPEGVTAMPFTPEVGARLVGLDELVSLALGDMIQSVASIAKTVAHEDYIKSQSASEVAVLLGTISDKAFRILEAYESARAGSDAEPPTPELPSSPQPEVVPS